MKALVRQSPCPLGAIPTGHDSRLGAEHTGRACINRTLHGDGSGLRSSIGARGTSTSETTNVHLVRYETQCTDAGKAPQCSSVNDVETALGPRDTVTDSTLEKTESDAWQRPIATMSHNSQVRPERYGAALTIPSLTAEEQEEMLTPFREGLLSMRKSFDNMFTSLLTLGNARAEPQTVTHVGPRDTRNDHLERDAGVLGPRDTVTSEEATKPVALFLYRDRHLNAAIATAPRAKTLTPSALPGEGDRTKSQVPCGH